MSTEIGQSPVRRQVVLLRNGTMLKPDPQAQTVEQASLLGLGVWVLEQIDPLPIKIGIMRHSKASTELLAPDVRLCSLFKQSIGVAEVPLYPL